MSGQARSELKARLGTWEDPLCRETMKRFFPYVQEKVRPDWNPVAYGRDWNGDHLMKQALGSERVCHVLRQLGVRV